MLRLYNFLRTAFTGIVNIVKLILYMLKCLRNFFKILFKKTCIVFAFSCSLCVFWTFWVLDLKFIYSVFWGYLFFIFYLFLIFLIFTNNFSIINTNVIVFFFWFHFFESIFNYFFVIHIMSSTTLLIEVLLHRALQPLELFVFFITDCLKQAANFWVSSFNFHTSYITVFYRPRLLYFIKFLINCWIYIDVVLIPLFKSAISILLDFIFPFNVNNLIVFLRKPNSLEIIFLSVIGFCGKLVFNVIKIFYLLVSEALIITDFIKSGLPLLSDLFHSFFGYCDALLEVLRLIKIYYHPYESEMFKEYLEEAQKINENLEIKDDSQNNDKD